MNKKYNWNLWQSLGGLRGQEPYIDNSGGHNRLYLDSRTCKDFDEFKVRAEIAINAYYCMPNPLNGELMQTSQLPLSAEPVFLTEYVPEDKIFGKQAFWRMWINVLVKDDTEYHAALAQAIMQRDRQDKILKEHHDLYPIAKIHEAWGRNIVKYVTNSETLREKGYINV